MAHAVHSIDITEEVTKLVKFDNDFRRIFAETNANVTRIVTVIEKVKAHLVELKEKRRVLIEQQHTLIAKIKTMRETVHQDETHTWEDDGGEFGGYDSDGQFEYGTCPSIKAMVKLSTILTRIKCVSDEISGSYSQIDRMRKQILEVTATYRWNMHFARFVAEDMSDETNEIAKNVFCWSNIGCGICTHHQRGKCIYGPNCKKAHLPIMAGYPYIRHIYDMNSHVYR